MNCEPGPDLKIHPRAKQDTAHGIRALARYLQKCADERDIEQCRLLMVKLARDRFAPEYEGNDFAANQKRRALLVSVVDEALVLVERASSRLQFLKIAGETPAEEIGKKTAVLVERFRLLREARRKLFIDVCERIVSSEEEKMSSAAAEFVAARTRALFEELDEIFRRAGRTVVFKAARRLGRDVSARIAQDIHTWAGQQARRLNSELIEGLRDEWAQHGQELDGMPVVADKILEAVRSIDFRPGEDFERPLHEMISPPSISKMEWRPRIPPAVAFLPVRIARSLTDKRLLEQMRRFLAAFIHSAEQKLLSEVGGALEGLGAEMERRAAEVETGVLDAFRGKRSLKGIDGRLRAARFEVEEIDREIALLAGIEKRLGSIRLELLQAESAPEGPQIDPACCSTPAGDEISEEPVEMDAALSVGDRPNLDADLKTRGCAVCNKMSDELARFLADRQYAVSALESARREFADSLGFCPLHMWQLEALSSPHGLSIGLSTSMDKLSADLARCSREPNPGESFGKLAQAPRRCAVCELLQDVEDKYLDNLARFLQIDEGLEAYTHSQGVCLRHLGMLIAKTPDKGIVMFLLDHASRLFLQLSEDMLNYALKRDALRADLLNRDENDAYLRAIIHTAGAKRICTPGQL